MRGSVRRIVGRLRPRPAPTPLARRVMAAGLTYLGPPKMLRLEHALRHLHRRRISGDFVEFGIALGGSGIVIADQARKMGRNFHGFDVFGMIPPPTSEKDDDVSRQRYEVIASGNATGLAGAKYYGYVTDLYQQVCDNFSTYGIAVDGTNVALHRGLFEDTWPKADVQRIAFAHLDCDWYDPVRYCLDAVAERVSAGGIVLLDDYNDYGGCRTAVDEFLASRSDYDAEHGPNLILRRSAGL